MVLTLTGGPALFHLSRTYSCTSSPTACPLSSIIPEPPSGLVVVASQFRVNAQELGNPRPAGQRHDAGDRLTEPHFSAGRRWSASERSARDSDARPALISCYKGPLLAHAGRISNEQDGRNRWAGTMPSERQLSPVSASKAAIPLSASFGRCAGAMSQLGSKNTCDSNANHPLCGPTHAALHARDESKTSLRYLALHSRAAFRLGAARQSIGRDGALPSPCNALRQLSCAWAETRASS